jgi:hypothetical protein
MKLSELYQIVNRSYDPSQPLRDAEVVIRVRLLYTTIGAVPTRAVKQANLGFDWENGRFLITPAEDLTPVDLDLDKKFRELQEKAGRLELENRDLKKRLKDYSTGVE